MSMIPIIERVENNDPTHKVLYLSESKIDFPDLQRFATALIYNQTLQSLTLRNCYLGSKSAEMLKAVLARNFTLISLDLSSNQIGDDGFQHLVSGLLANSFLRTLNLQNNQITSTGAKCLGAALPKLRALLKLFLGDNPLGDEGVQNLCKGLKGNRTLTHLDLSSTKTSDLGAHSIAELVGHTRSLIELNLGKNRIHRTEQEGLSAALKKNHSITTLTLDQPPEAIKTTLKRNQTHYLDAFDACKRGDLGTLKAIHQLGICLLFQNPDENEDTLLHAAVTSGNPKVVDYLVNAMRTSSHPIDVENHDFCSALAIAKEKKLGHIERLFLTNPTELGDETFIKNRLLAQLDQLQAERIQLECRVFGVLNPLKEHALKLARATEVNKLIIQIIGLVAEETRKQDSNNNNSPPTKSLFHLLQALYQISSTLYFEQEVLPIVKQRYGNEVARKYKGWLQFEKRLHKHFTFPKETELGDYFRLGCQTPSLDEYVLSLNNESLSVSFYQYKQDRGFETIREIWETHHKPQLAALRRSLLGSVLKTHSADTSQQLDTSLIPKLMNDLYQREITYFFERTVITQMIEFVDGRCRHLTADEQNELIKKYLHPIQKIEKVEARQFEFPPLEKLAALVASLNRENAIMDDTIAHAHDTQATLGTELHSGIEDALDKMDHVKGRLSSTTTAIRQSVVYLAAFGTLKEIQEYLKREYPRCRNEATQEVSSSFLKKPYYFFYPEEKRNRINELTDAKMAILINTPTMTGKTALQQACFCGRPDFVKFLLLHGANVSINVCDDFGNPYSPFHYACYCPDKADVIEILNTLETCGKDVNPKGARGRTPLHTAAITNNSAAAQWFLDHNANINAPEEEGTLNTPLHNAAMCGSFEVAKLLLEKGAQTTLRDDQGHTPLMLAILFGGTEEKAVGAQGELKRQSNASTSHLDIINLFFKMGITLNDEEIESLRRQSQTMPHINQILDLVMR